MSNVKVLADTAFGQVAVSDGIVYTLTRCCRASYKGSGAVESGVVCRACYAEQDGPEAGWACLAQDEDGSGLEALTRLLRPSLERLAHKAARGILEQARAA